MSDKKKNDDDVEWGADWDSALDEWEKGAFSGKNFSEAPPIPDSDPQQIAAAAKSPASVTLVADRPRAPVADYDALEATRTHFDPALLEMARPGSDKPSATRVPVTAAQRVDLSATLGNEGATAEVMAPTTGTLAALKRSAAHGVPSLSDGPADAAPTTSRRLLPEGDAEGSLTVPSTRKSGSLGAPAARKSGPPPVPLTIVANEIDDSSGELTFEGERPAREWLADDVRDSFVARAEWMEAEAALASDQIDAARLLLHAAELRAIAGHRDRAQALAVQAAQQAPAHELSARVKRSYAMREDDVDRKLEALAAEVLNATTDASRLHAQLLAVDVARYGNREVAPLLAPLQASTDARVSALLAAMRVADVANNPNTAPHLPPAPDYVIRAVGDNLVRLLAGAATSVPVATPSSTNTSEPPPESLAVDGETPSPTAPSVNLRALQTSLQDQRIAEAVSALQRLASDPALDGGAAWLSALLATQHDGTRPAAAEYLVKAGQDPSSLRALAAFGVETGTAPLVDLALEDAEALRPGERATLAALFKRSPPGSPANDAEALGPLGFAIASLDPEVRLTKAARPAQLLARQLVSGVADDALVLGEMDDAPSLAALKVARSIKRGESPLDELTGDQSASDDAIIGAALAAEILGRKQLAQSLYERAAGHDEWRYAARLVMVDDGSGATTLATLAAEYTGVRGGVLAIEALARANGDGEAGPSDRTTRAELIALAHEALPALGIAAFVGERDAAAIKDSREAARWFAERRPHIEDSLELAIELVREGLFYAESSDIAGERILEAHHARPGELALRDLAEAQLSDLLDDTVSWRERNSALFDERTSAVLLLEAAYDRVCRGAYGPAAQLAQRAAEGGSTLASVVCEDAELESGDSASLAERLLSAAKEDTDAQRRLEAYERLADLDARRNDMSSSLLWHRTILEEFPGHLPSLRAVEHSLIGEGRDEELESVAASIARSLSGRDGPEASAHAALAIRLKVRAGDAFWPQTRELAELAASQGVAPLWSVRAVNAHARHHRDDGSILSSSLELASRASRPLERAAHYTRAADAAQRLGKLDEAETALERAVTEDPGDVLAWGMLVDVREQAGHPRDAAEACESVARTTFVDQHRLVAWYDAAGMWQRQGNEEHATIALEHAAAINPAYEDVFGRLSQLYGASDRKADLASLLERRLDSATSDSERVTLQVQLGQAQMRVGDLQGARRTFEAALELAPDHPEALAQFANLCADAGDPEAAEAALLRLSRISPTADEQAEVYRRLATLYDGALKNPSRAEACLLEVLKRRPNDEPAMAALASAYRDSGDLARAVETFEAYLKLAQDPETRLLRLVALGALHETASPRKAEAVLEGARKEFPTSVRALRALAEFYARQKQTPAVNVLLDRAAGDARRALTAGRFTASLFETLAVVAELRGRTGGATVVSAALGAFQGTDSALSGASARCVDPRLDEFLAPEILSPALRGLLARTGDALDAAAPLELRQFGAEAVPSEHARVVEQMGQLAQQMGMGGLQVLMSTRLGRVCLPCSSNPPTLLVGEPLLSTKDDAARTFLVLRALKLVYMRASALVRTPAAELAPLVGAWFKHFNPSWVAPGLNAPQVAEAARKLAPSLAPHRDPQLGAMALEAAAALSNLSPAIGSAAVSWANRSALLGVGDPSAALTAVAWSLGQDAIPAAPEARASWIARTADARDLLSFGVSDGYLEARRRAGLTA